jgi:hypothetical protein
MTTKALFPSSEPAIELDFANTKALDPRITFTRVMTGASVATYVGADGLIKTAGNNVPRFDHNPTTGESLGLLVEEARTNEMSQSIIRPDNAGIYSRWTEGDGASIVPDAGLAPDGTFTAALVTFPQSTFVPKVSRQTTIASGVRSVSVWLKAASGTIQVRVGNSNDFGATQTIGTQWTRVTYVVAAGSSNFAGIYCPSPQVFTEFYAWGFQQEPGSFSTSYIPTSGSTVTRAADVATVSNTNSRIFPTSSFTTINSPFGTAGGGSTVKLVGPTIKRTAIYNGDLPQSQINALTGTSDFWRWRVTGPTFALPNFTTNGSVTVDWGDGVVEAMTTGVHTFLDSNVYHTIGFRQNSGTFFKPNINGNSTYAPRVIAVGPAPASIKVDVTMVFNGCSGLRNIDGYVDFSGGGSASPSFAFQGCSSLVNLPLTNLGTGTSYQATWENCFNLISFPSINTSSATNFNQTWANCYNLASFSLINTSAVTSFTQAWYNCSSLTSFPLINTAAGTNFYQTWANCTSLTSFPAINAGAATNFVSAWNNCSKLTLFPAINVNSGTEFALAWTDCSSLTSFPLLTMNAATSVQQAWQGCSGLTSFPALNLSSVTNCSYAWRFCSNLISFPAITIAAATTFDNAWAYCTKLTTFPANMFNTTGTLVSSAFSGTFFECALTATSIENILTSLVTNGRSNITLTLSGGTNAGASTWTANAITAYNTLISRGWTITRNA